jgi:hypothetical protein
MEVHIRHVVDFFIVTDETNGQMVSILLWRFLELMTHYLDLGRYKIAG